ncbi:MAG: DNA/RNA non-specific endonuclease [Clostridia bacterium]|nr:DNA/RNA non-specific endonuclease [Clostridia bacterium]
MNQLKKVLQWVAAVFCFLSVFAFGFHIASLVFLFVGILALPLKSVRHFIKTKIKLQGALLGVIATVLFFVGVFLAPKSQEAPADPPLSETQTVEAETEESSKEETLSEEALYPLTKEDESPATKEDSAPSEKEENPNPVVPNSENLGTKKLLLSSVPAYSDLPFAVVCDNLPFFTESEVTSTAFESYSDLDALGRCGAALASCGKEIMPKEGEERGSISSIRPSGWVQAQYDVVSGKYLYNRCHLIGWQLSAENANKKNLITGTKYINVEGMLPFENMVADYIKETGNHVMYRITPHYKGDDLVASGVQMEAYSVEDGGDGICFNVFCYNVQPGVKIDYATGKSTLMATPPASTTKTPTTTTKAQGQTLSMILNTNTKKAHRTTCASAKKISEKNRKEYTGTTASVEAMGYSLCKNCF